MKRSGLAHVSSPIRVVVLSAHPAWYLESRLLERRRCTSKPWSCDMDPWRTKSISAWRAFAACIFSDVGQCAQAARVADAAAAAWRAAFGSSLLWRRPSPPRGMPGGSAIFRLLHGLPAFYLPATRLAAWWQMQTIFFAGPKPVSS